MNTGLTRRFGPRELVANFGARIGLVLIFVVVITLYLAHKPTIDIELSKYPDGKRFAFTITDDPDYGWLRQKEVVYGLLSQLDMKITIPVWVLDNSHGTGIEGMNHSVGGITTTDEKYLAYMRQLQESGHEIALHTVGPGNDLRDETILGYELFKAQFGQYPNVNINHVTNLDNIYWGGDRFSNRVLRYFYSLTAPESLGHIEESEYFWGDISKVKSKYVRGWATDSINTLSVNRSMPYHLEDKPYVNYWFGCSDGFDYDKFMKLISKENIERLIAERGTSIIYTHFAYGFVDKSTNILSKDFVKRVTEVSQENGWFVPVSTILDRFLLMRNVEVVNSHDSVAIINKNSMSVDGVTILTDQKSLYFHNTGEWKSPNDEGEILLGDMPAHSVFRVGTNESENMNKLSGVFERIDIVWSWLIGR